MKNLTGDASVSTAFGQKVEPAIDIKFEYEAFESADEVRQKYTPKELDELIVSSANAASKANARAKATNEALEARGIKRPDPNSPEVLRKGMIANLVKLQGVSEDVAAQIVDGILGAVTK